MGGGGGSQATPVGTTYPGGTGRPSFGPHIIDAGMVALVLGNPCFFLMENCWLSSVSNLFASSKFIGG